MAPSHLQTAYPNYVSTSSAWHLLAVLLIVLAIVHIRKDFRDFIALGPGGTPQTWRGYMRIKFLGMFALRNPYQAIVFPDDLPYRKGNLHEIPTRKHDRPHTKGIAPHRQIDQRAEELIFMKLAAAIRDMAPGANNDLTIGTSCFEAHSVGLFATCPANQTCRGEIVHAHPSDGSMHLTLHPLDANVVLSAGWGERHPMAGVFSSRFLPLGFMMVYAPQNDEEIELVLRIIRAACWFVGEGDAAQATASFKMASNDSCNNTSAGTISNYINQRQIEIPDKALAKIL